MKFKILTIASLVAFSLASAQQHLPADYLSKEFHAARRTAFRNLMPANSVAVIFSYPERVFSNDVNYVFHQNPDLYYLSGYTEPDAVLLIFKEAQQKDGQQYSDLFFVRQRDSAREIWTGRRLGVEGVKNKLGFSQVYTGKDFAGYGIDFSKFSTVIYDDIPEDIRDNQSGFDLAGLLKTFKEKINPPGKKEKELHKELLSIGRFATAANLKNFIDHEKEKAATNELFQKDILMNEFINLKDSSSLADLIKKIKDQKPWATELFDNITAQLREIKTPEELVLLRKSVKISGIAHKEAMKAIKPEKSEREIEGVHSFIHKKYGAEEEGYPPIVGAGGNGCILHYEENSALKIDNQLLLMDVASEYHGYSADITRTIPANGKFTPEQKAIYQLVYNAQDSVFKLCKEGTPFPALNKKAREVLAEGLIKLGIIKDKSEVRTYYPHGCSHHMGLDVHDKSAYGTLKENMVITVEPGIYIPAGSACDKKWWNIGVRIEDDVIIGKEGCENMSADTPRKWEDVEKAASQKSNFNNMGLPDL